MVRAGVKVANWEFVKTVDDAASLLTLNADEAFKMKLSQRTVDTEPQLNAALNIRGNVIRLEFSWAERATVFLTTWEIRLLLFVGMLVFAWLEFAHPGVSVFGIAAILCLALLIGAPFLTGLAQIWEIALIVIGLGIIIADLLAFGGLGMLAVPGFILMAIGLVASFVPSDPGGGINSSHNAWAAAEQGLGVIVGGTFLAAGCFYVMAKYLAVVPGFNRLQLAPGGSRAALRGRSCLWCAMRRIERLRRRSSSEHWAAQPATFVPRARRGSAIIWSPWSATAALSKKEPTSSSSKPTACASSSNPTPKQNP